MKNKFLVLGACLILSSMACSKSDSPATAVHETDASDDFQYAGERFGDYQVLRYQFKEWDKLTLKQKQLVYYLVQSGLAGRDIMYAQNYKHNLEIRKGLESIYKNYKGDRKAPEWIKFHNYLKEIWMNSGIHESKSTDKFMPEFTRANLEAFMKDSQVALSAEILDIIFNADKDAKKVNLDSALGLIKASAVNFYDPSITEKEVEDFYAKIQKKDDPTPISYGLNSRLLKDASGNLYEETYKVGGLYSKSLEQVVYWLKKAQAIAENESQAKTIGLLIEYFQTGDLKTWDEFNLAWINSTEGDIDFIHGFVEVYNDPLGYRGSYETIVQVKDFGLSDKMKVLADNAKWFEDNSPTMKEHKREKIQGVSYKVVNVAGLSGDASPTPPIGVNLPNSEWMRAKHGSKAVSLGNLITAYDKSASGSSLKEFAYTDQEAELIKKYGSVAGDMTTAMHEVIGHASGQINPGVPSTNETLKNYASTLEEGRADLVGLYYIADPQLIKWGLIENEDVAKAEYISYIQNGLMKQLRRIKPGKNVEEAHMRNRQMVSAWVYEKGKAENVIEKKVKDGKTYFVINDFAKLRTLFGQLLREVQRITSEGDYNAARDLIENYGVKVDPTLHAEVLARYKALDLAVHKGFINPDFNVKTNKQGDIEAIDIVYPKDFTEQMLSYSERYSFENP